MNAEKLKNTFLAKGFKYLKVELEAHLNSIEFDPDTDEAEHLSDFSADLRAEFGRILGLKEKYLKYFSVYHDGSVNTEVTFTLRVDALDLLPSLTQAFADTCKNYAYEYGADLETDNAGTHITLMEGYSYPRAQLLPPAKVWNFQAELEKLLFALYFLATPDPLTRSFEYRQARISATEKYSAIYLPNSACIEYRLFDACLHKPSYMLNYLTLIAKTLRYYEGKGNKRVNLKNKTPLSLELWQHTRMERVRHFDEAREICESELPMRYVKRVNLLNFGRSAYYTSFNELLPSATARRRLIAELKHFVRRERAEALEVLGSSDSFLLSAGFWKALREIVHAPVEEFGGIETSTSANKEELKTRARHEQNVNSYVSELRAHVNADARLLDRFISKKAINLIT